MTPLLTTVVFAAEKAAEVPDAAVKAAGPITLSLLFVFLVISFIAVKAYKMKVGAIVLGACVGVLGAGSPFVGGLVGAVIEVVVKLIGSVASSVG